MNSRRIACACLLAALFTGCQQQTRKPEPIASAPLREAPADIAPATQPSEVKFNAPEALARKTAEYSQEVQSLPTPQSEQPMLAPDGSPSSARVPETAQTKIPENPSAFPPGNDPLDARQAAHRANLGASPGRANLVPDAPPRVGVGANAGASLNDSSAPSTQPAQQVRSDLSSLGSVELAQKLDRRVRDNPRDVSAHLDYQLMRFLLDDRVPDLAALASLPTEDRELIASVLDGLMNFRSGLRQDNNMLLSRKVRPMIEMADRLRAQADMTIPTIALCKSVRTFGEYDPIDPPRFAAGKPHETILYCEVANFSSQLNDRSFWQTLLSQEAVLYTENGAPVWNDKTESITDAARVRRHDFFIVKKLQLPANLAVGRYLLKVTVVDQQVSRVAEATVPIVIVAQ